MPESIEDRNVSVRALILEGDSILVELWPPTGVCFPPGGRTRLGENLKSALERELEEELGAAAVEITRYIGVNESKWIEGGHDHKVKNHLFLGRWLQSAGLVPDSPEGRKFKWIRCTSTEFSRLVPPSLKELVQALASGKEVANWYSCDESS